MAALKIADFQWNIYEIEKFSKFRWKVPNFTGVFGLQEKEIIFLIIIHNKF